MISRGVVRIYSIKIEIYVILSHVRPRPPVKMREEPKFSNKNNNKTFISQDSQICSWSPHIEIWRHVLFSALWRSHSVRSNVFHIHCFIYSHKSVPQNQMWFVRFRLPLIYDEFSHTINNADHEKDLKWWSNNHGVNMAMNWPQFEVRRRIFSRFPSI